jgi:hypothetical protein
MDRLIGKPTECSLLEYNQITRGPPPLVLPDAEKAKVTELNDYRPRSTHFVIMKCFEKLDKVHITSTLPETLDPTPIFLLPQ